jgi:predicted dehydrogenase
MAKTGTNKIRFGIVGLGFIGLTHGRLILGEWNRDFCLGAVADSYGDAARRAGGEFDVPWFRDHRDMLAAGLVDAVIVCTPHFWHPPIAIEAARAGIHVLCEKPLAATIGPARLMVEECRRSGVACGAVLQHRTRGIMRKMKQIVDSGRLGEVVRVEMTCTDWYRTQAYYDSSPWRGTWDGEGGGLMQNQMPHHLDLFQWIGGMPRRVSAILTTRLHRIEVENTANIIFEYGEGKTGYMYASTAELPGRERFMVVGDRGTIVCEGGKLRLGRLEEATSKHLFECPEARADFIRRPACEWEDVPIPGRVGGQHVDVIRAFARHILSGSEMVASAEEALNEVELANAAYVSAFKKRAVDLPVDAREMDDLLARIEAERSAGEGLNQRAEAAEALARLMQE